MGQEDIELAKSATNAAYITLSVMVPIIMLYLASQEGLVSFDFSIPVPFSMSIIGLTVIFNLVFSISVMDQWRK